MQQLVSKGVKYKYFEWKFVYDQYSSESEEKDLLISVSQINLYSSSWTGRLAGTIFFDGIWKFLHQGM